MSNLQKKEKYEDLSVDALVLQLMCVVVMIPLSLIPLFAPIFWSITTLWVISFFVFVYAEIRMRMIKL